MLSAGLLVLRVVLGLYLFGHGAQKLFGWFGGSGLAKTTAGMGHMGFRPPQVAALLSSGAETAGGVATALGFLSPLGPIAIAATMVVAGWTHVGRGVWGKDGGFELPLTYLAAALALALAGDGRVSLDAALGIALPEPATLLIFGALAALGVAVMLLARRTTPAAQAHTTDRQATQAA